MKSTNEILLERVEALRQKTYDELTQMPSIQEQEIECSDGHIKLAIWKDSVGEFELRIVVQAYKHLIFGIGQMRADGFRATREAIKVLEKNDLAEFS